MKEWQDTLLNNYSEVTLLREIKDVLDDLFIMNYIKTQELTVTKAFVKQIPKTTLSTPSNRCPCLSADQQASNDSPQTVYHANELLEGLEAQVTELDALRSAAENTSNALRDLLSLKQQQSSLVEAREAARQGEETLRRGRTIMLFTIVTIILLRLSFFTGVFGMNAKNLTGVNDDSLYDWGDTFKIMGTFPAPKC